MILRTATAADAEALAAFAAGTPGAPSWAPYVYASLATDPAKLVLLLHPQEGTGLTGYAIAALLPPAPFEAELEAIAVHPAHRRCGHGATLLHAVQRWSADRAATALHLEVRESNAAAVELYRAAGFTATGRRRAYYRHPVEDAVLMQWTPPAGNLRGSPVPPKLPVS